MLCRRGRARALGRWCRRAGSGGQASLKSHQRPLTSNGSDDSDLRPKAKEIVKSFLCLLALSQAVFFFFWFFLVLSWTDAVKLCLSQSADKLELLKNSFVCGSCNESQGIAKANESGRRGGGEWEQEVDSLGQL